MCKQISALEASIDKKDSRCNALENEVHDLNEWVLELDNERIAAEIVQMICELLINGTAPTAVPSTIQSIYEMLYDEPPEELPSVNFVRECRVVVEIIGETMVAIKLGHAEIWDQLWTDSTTRRQIPFTALIIGILADSGNIDPIVVSSCIFMEDERSETQVDGIVNKVNQ